MPVSTEQLNDNINSNTLKSVIIANPAAGAEFTTTVPAGEVWLILSLRFVLATSATVATRRCNILGTFSAVPVNKATNTVTQAASLSYTYRFGSFANYNTQFGSETWQGLTSTYLSAGTVFSSQTDSIQVGDQYSGIVLVYRKFPS